MSTSRYTNAGDVGVGTVTDNMKSRVKAWGVISPTPSLAAGFNVSSFTDLSGVGYGRLNFISPLGVNVSVAQSTLASTQVSATTGTTTDIYTYTWTGSVFVAAEAWTNVSVSGALV